MMLTLLNLCGASPMRSFTWWTALVTVCKAIAQLNLLH
jgi:hypothetical protein